MKNTKTKKQKEVEEIINIAKEVSPNEIVKEIKPETDLIDLMKENKKELVEKMKDQVLNTVEEINLSGANDQATAEPEQAPAEPFKKPRKKRITKAEKLAQTQNIFSSVQDDEAETEEPAEKEGELTLNNVFPSGGLITVVDKLMSTLLPLAINAISKSKVSSQDFALDAAEKKAISPALDECAKTINLNFNNPWVNLGIIIAGVYGSKAIQVINFESYGEPKRKRRS